MTLETGAHYPLRLESLPAGWRAGYVGDFVKEIEPGFASGEHNQTGNGVPHLRPMNVDRDGKIDLSVVKYVAPEKDRRRLRPGDVLFNNTNSPELVGKTAVVSQRGDLAFSNHMTRIRFGDDVLPKFGAIQLHFLWMRGYFRYNCVKHVNQASVSSKTLARAIPFVWAPVEEQERIVAEIEKQFSRLDEAADNLKRIRANLKRYRAAVLNGAVDGRLVPTEADFARREKRSYESGDQLLRRLLGERRRRWRGKTNYREPANPVVTDLPHLPEGWVWASLEQLNWEAGYGTSVKCSYDEQGPPVLRIPNVENASLDLTDLKFGPTSLAINADDAISVGDMLVIRTNGSKSLIGRAAVVRELPRTQMTFASYLIRFRLLEADALAAWVSTLWQSNSIRSWIESSAATSAGQYNISMSVLATAAIPLPPMAEQRRITAEVDRQLSLIHGLESELYTSSLRADHLRESVLSIAFSERA